MPRLVLSDPNTQGGTHRKNYLSHNALWKLRGSRLPLVASRLLLDEAAPPIRVFERSSNLPLMCKVLSADIQQKNLLQLKVDPHQLGTGPGFEEAVPREDLVIDWKINTQSLYKF